MSRSNEEGYAANTASYTAQEVRQATIRHLNDQLRRLFAGGRVMITSGIRKLGSQAVQQVLDAVCRFAAFNPDNDPHDEHDFGAVDVAGQRVFWKIDCYDEQLEYGSPDPADPAVTARVLTIMLASEY